MTQSTSNANEITKQRQFEMTTEDEKKQFLQFFITFENNFWIDSLTIDSRRIMTGFLPFSLSLLLLVVIPLSLTSAAHHDIDFLVEEWVVDYLRPTKALSTPLAAKRVTPFKIPDANRKGGPSLVVVDLVSGVFC